MRIILYTGKGGVGKTTVAAATAVRCAELGHRTLVISTDPAHSLADAFNQRLGADPTPIRKHLWGLEVNVLEEIRANWGEIAQYFAALFASRGVDEVVAEEMAILPGTDELCGLLQIRRHAAADELDCLIVDCAPTGETLRLLSFPDAARWYMQKLFPWERRIMRTVRPAIQRLVDIPLPRDQFFAGIERLFRGVEEVKNLLVDGRRSTVRLVLNPEKMVIKESQRALTYLNLYGYTADAIVNNRLFPEAAGERVLGRWRAIQARYGEEIRESFAPLPVWDVPLFDREVVGLDMLGRMGGVLFGERDPMDVYAAGPVQTVRKEQDAYVLSLRLPFASRHDVALDKVDDELVVSVGNFRRVIFLPRALASSTVEGATVDADWLRIRFARAGGRATGGGTARSARPRRSERR
jgi:arsenite/tail-anchored protein-transporting ATPase